MVQSSSEDMVASLQRARRWAFLVTFAFFGSIVGFNVFANDVFDRSSYVRSIELTTRADGSIISKTSIAETSLRSDLLLVVILVVVLFVAAFICAWIVRGLVRMRHLNRRRW